MPIISSPATRYPSRRASKLAAAFFAAALALSSPSNAIAHQPTTSQSKATSTISATTNPRLTQEIQLTGDTLWLNTAIDILPGERLHFSAAGALRYPDANSDSSPAGLPRSFKDLLRNLPLNDAGRGALIARIGDQDIASPFLIGSKRDLIAPAAGRLSVGINQSAGDTAHGTYEIEITIYPPEAHSISQSARIVPTLPGIDNNLLAKIPRRIADKSGTPGDMVNFLIIGSQTSVVKAFTTAGWVQVDSSVTETLVNGLIATLSKEAYLTMPMSQLYLFGRPQDYGWAHAEPIEVVASRHHLRLWRAPYLVNGESLWVGAATHDTGFEHDQRSRSATSITHKIDPDIDLERDYVEKTLTNTGQVSELTHFLPPNPVRSAATATGAPFHSNGQVLILKLIPAETGPKTP